MPFLPPSRAALPVAGSDLLFPVRRVHCIGRSYAAHASEMGHPSGGAITLSVNGEMRQEGDLNQMIWKVPEMISDLSEYFELAAGDVILSGTPSGVGPVARGDEMVVTVEGRAPLTVRVV